MPCLQVARFAGGDEVTRVVAVFLASRVVDVSAVERGEDGAAGQAELTEVAVAREH